MIRPPALAPALSAPFEVVRRQKTRRKRTKAYGGRESGGRFASCTNKKPASLVRAGRRLLPKVAAGLAVKSLTVDVGCSYVGCSYVSCVPRLGTRRICDQKGLGLPEPAVGPEEDTGVESTEKPEHLT